jgi:hypothetical protein
MIAYEMTKNENNGLLRIQVFMKGSFSNIYGEGSVASLWVPQAFVIYKHTSYKKVILFFTNQSFSRMVQEIYSFHFGVYYSMIGH